MNKILTTAVLSLSFIASACNRPAPQIIDKVKFVVSQDLKTVSVSLDFAKTIRTILDGDVAIKNYGSIFLKSYTPTTPFSLGFALNTDIFNDQDYVNLTPTETLPNGLPIGIGYPVVEIKGEQPISSKFDLYGYLDIGHQSWIGVSTLFSFIDATTFPAGLSVQKTFFPSPAGLPGAIVSVFGPVVDANGVVIRQGGIALYTNVKQLVQQYPPHSLLSEAERTVELYPSDEISIEGANSAFYRSHPEKLLPYMNRMIKALNRQ